MAQEKKDNDFKEKISFLLGIHNSSSFLIGILGRLYDEERNCHPTDSQSNKKKPFPKGHCVFGNDHDCWLAPHDGKNLFNKA